MSAKSSSSSVRSWIVCRALMMRRTMTDRSFLRLRIFSCTAIGSSEPAQKVRDKE